MNKYYSPNESQMRAAVKGADRHDYYKRRRSPAVSFMLRGLAVVILLIAFFAACLIIAEVIR